MKRNASKAATRWFRIPLIWDMDSWLYDCSALAQFAWIQLLRESMRGYYGGWCERKPKTFASGRCWKVPVEAILEMERAAITAGALSIHCEDGREMWRIEDWGAFIPPNPAKEKARYPSQWDKVRARVLERDNYTCTYCGAEANHCDHVIPRVQGGADDESNLVAACGYCNRSKGGRRPEEWRPQ